MQSAILDAESRLGSSTTTEAARPTPSNALKQNLGKSNIVEEDKRASGVDSDHNASVKERFAQVKEGEPVDHDHVTLKPVVHETRHIHEVEEITKTIEKERHIHHVLVHEIPLQRPRKIVTRVRVIVETEVLPEEWTAEEIAFAQANPGSTGDASTTPAASKPMSKVTAKEEHCADGELRGRYGPYAKACHDRAVELFTRDLAEHTMNKLAQSFKDDPPIPAGSRIVSSESTKENLAILKGSAFGAV